MTAALAAVAGYLLGSVPSAGWLARRRGFDLLHEGSGNPGTNNALRLGGPVLAASVLTVELVKGYAAVHLGLALAAEVGALTAGLAAVIGNVVNVWYRGGGGKGLAISGGVLAAASPLLMGLSVLIIAAVALTTRSSGKAALVALAGLTVGAIALAVAELNTPGVLSGGTLVALTVGMAIVLAPKHWRDVQVKRSGHPVTR